MDLEFEMFSNMPISFLVTGAIESPMGVVTSQDRLLQTTNTFDSILSTFPDARIHYVDAGSLTPESSSGLAFIAGDVESVLDLRSSGYVKERLKTLTESPSQTLDGVTKSLLEAYSYKQFFESKTEFQRGELLIKVSARYKVLTGLRRNVDAWRKSGLDYMAGKPKRTYLNPRSSEFSRFRRTVLWGLCTESIPSFTKLTERAIYILTEKLDTSKPFDLEHAFHHILPHDNVFEVRRLHVSGQVASFGRSIRL
jgi:hypothetical protein